MSELDSNYPRAASPSEANSRLWPIVTVALLTVGYAGYYLCRSDLSVSQTSITDFYKAQGIGYVDKAWFGALISLATGLYAAGKFLFGNLADALGGRKTFLLGMGGAIVCTLLFGAGGLPLFYLAWCGNRFIQASGWVGMIKVSSRWFSHNVYGTVMGVISLSFLFGDFLSRLFLGVLINRGWTWQQVFYISAAVLTVIFVPTVLFLRNTPRERGLPDPEANPESVFADKEDAEQIKRPIDLLLPLFKSTEFWVVCALSFGFTFMRETFNDWIPTYLHEAAKMSKGDAATASSLFPLFGGFSVLGVGYMSDRMKVGGRAAIIAIGLAFTTVGLLILATGQVSSSVPLAVGFMALMAFVMIGPYSFLAGAVSMDLGGKQASASAAGWIDGIGYIGGMLSGSIIGSVAEKAGWSPAFGVMAGVAFLSLIAGVVYWRQERAKAHALGMA